MCMIVAGSLDVIAIPVGDLDTARAGLWMLAGNLDIIGTPKRWLERLWHLVWCIGHYLCWWMTYCKMMCRILLSCDSLYLVLMPKCLASFTWILMNLYLSFILFKTLYILYIAYLLAGFFWHNFLGVLPTPFTMSQRLRWSRWSLASGIPQVVCRWHRVASSWLVVEGVVGDLMMDFIFCSFVMKLKFLGYPLCIKLYMFFLYKLQCM